MKRILIDITTEPAQSEYLQSLSDIEVEFLEPGKHRRQVPASRLRDVQVLLCKHVPLNFEDLDCLEWLQLSTVGHEHLRELKLADRPIRVTNARGVFDTAIAEWNLAMMINLTRDLRGMIRRQESRVWERADRFQQEIRGRVVGLWGYGGIGRETARLAKSFGMSVHVMTRSGVKPRHEAYSQPGTGDPDGVLPDAVFTSGQERDFLGGLDFLILALPRTTLTTGLIGEPQLRALPRTAFVLNPARGLIIQEQALLQVLREGRLAGAALDTHYAYPLPADHPLWQFPNVILTPHISGADHSSHFLGRIWDLFMQNLERYLRGDPLLNEVSKSELREA